MHGIDQTPESWILGSSTGKNLPYQLATLGYDVWLGVKRGTASPDYSDNPSLNPVTDSNSYWNFSDDEIAKYDFPA
jgi:lysosomal acid lipase/cholesteryl ester hydrolase